MASRGVKKPDVQVVPVPRGPRRRASCPAGRCRVVVDDQDRPGSGDDGPDQPHAPGHVRGLGGPGDPGLSGEHSRGVAVQPGEDHRNPGEDLPPHREQELQGVVVQGHDQVGAVVPVFVGQVAPEAGQVLRPGKSLDVQVLDAGGQVRVGLAQALQDSCDLLAGPFLALVVGVEEEDFGQRLGGAGPGREQAGQEQTQTQGTVRRRHGQSLMVGHRRLRMSGVGVDGAEEDARPEASDGARGRD
jgi:hypothetical protein